MPFKSDKQRRYLWAQKPDVARQIAQHKVDGGPIQTWAGLQNKIKKVTNKDRYGNQVSVEYQEEEKPFNINSLLEKMLDRDVPESFTVPEESPIGGGWSVGFGDHPGEPQGSDTVPAWLTPGEFVVNKEATDMYGPEIEAMNNHGRQVQNMKKGGPAYYWGGGEVDAKIWDYVDNWWAQPGASPERKQQKFDQIKQRWLERNPPPPTPDVPETPKVKSPLEKAKTPAPRPRPQSQAGVDWNIPLGNLFGADISTQGSYTAMDNANDPYKAMLKAKFKFQEGGTVPVPMSPVEALLRSREGYNPEVYLDSRDRPTVGHGHLLPSEYISREGERPFSDEQLSKFFQEDITTAKAGAKRNAEKYGVDWDKLNRREKTALTSMAFQLGETGQYEFENMWKALAAGDKETAALEALDSDWGYQTPERAKDVYSALTPGLGFKTGGPVYAYRGYEAAEQDAYDVEDPNLDLSSGWNPPVVPEPGGWDAGDAALMENYEMLEPVVPEDSEYQQRLAQQIAMAENMVAGGDGDDLGTAGTVPQAEEDSWWENVVDWTFDTSVADARNAGFNEKVAAANTKAAEEHLAEVQERIDSGKPVHSSALESAEQQVEHAKEQHTEAVIENAALNPEDTQEAYERESGINEMHEAIAQENEAGPDDDKAALDELAESPEFENEDDPSKDSDKGQQSPGEVVAEGEKAAKENPDMLKKAEGFFKGAFKDLFDGKELARMAIMYLGSRALGYSHGGSLNWAAKQYVTRLDAKQSTLSQNAKEFAKSGKYTPASVSAYQKTGDLSKLQPVGVTDNITGNVNTRSINGQKVAFQEIKRGDHTLYKAPDGTVYTAAQLENATQPYEPSFQKGTPEYRARRSRATGDAAGRFEEVRLAEDEWKDGQKTGSSTDIRPKQAADEFWAWSESMGLDPESDEALQIMTNAYRSAIADGKTGDVRPRSLKAYLQQEYIREKSGAPELFMTNPDRKPGESPIFIRGDKMASLDRNVKHVASQLPGLQGLDPKDAADRFYQLAVEEWGALDPDVQKQYNRSATKDESGFYLFMNKRASQLLAKAGG